MTPCGAIRCKVSREVAACPLFESSRDARHLRGGFVRELEPEMADAGARASRPDAGGFLRFGAEDGIAAADVGHHRMRAAGRIAQRHAMLFARAAAIAIAGAGRKEAAEDAVLGVEHRQVLIGDGFDAVRRRHGAASSATCAAFKSCVGRERSKGPDRATPRPRSRWRHSG